VHDIKPVADIINVMMQHAAGTLPALTDTLRQQDAWVSGLRAASRGRRF
jgi:hypothetical protein